MSDTKTPELAEVESEFRQSISDLTERVTEMRDERVTRDEAERIAAEAAVRASLAVPSSGGGWIGLGDTVPVKERQDAPFLTRGQSMLDYVERNDDGRHAFRRREAEEEFSLGKLVRGAVTGRWDESSSIEERAYKEGTPSAGGYTVPTLLSATVIDKVRNEAKVTQAGATIVPIYSDEVSMARVETDPVPGWRAEEQPLVLTSGTFGKVTFRPKTVGQINLISRELLADQGPGGLEAIENAIIQSMALELDRVCLRGSGVGSEPQGVLNQPGIQTQVLGTGNGLALGGYDPYINAISALKQVNRQPSGVIQSARTEKSIAKFVDGQGQPKVAPKMVAEVPQYSSNQVPSNLVVGSSNDCSELYTARWSDLLVGLRTDLTIETLVERYADTLQVGILAYLRADVQLAHADSFVVTTGVRE